MLRNRAETRRRSDLGLCGDSQVGAVSGRFAIRQRIAATAKSRAR
jgi:hypothetical protein